MKFFSVSAALDIDFDAFESYDRSICLTEDLWGNIHNYSGIINVKHEKVKHVQFCWAMRVPPPYI